MQKETNKRQVIHCVSDVDSSPPDWKICEVRTLATVDTAVHGNVTLGSKWDHGAASQTNSWPKWMSYEPCASEFRYVKTRRQNSPFFAKVLVSAESVTSSGCLDTPLLLRKWRPKPLTEFDKGHSRGSCQESHRVLRSKPRSARTSQELGARGQLTFLVPRPSHLGALIAAGPRVRDMIRDATIAGLTPAQPFVASRDNLIEAASTAIQKLTAQRWPNDREPNDCRNRTK